MSDISAFNVSVQPSKQWLRFGVRDLLLLLLLGMVGSVNLIYPLAGDQSLFATGAAAMSRGAVLYRDFWDLKQPGIYLFYLLAGMSFGLSELGIHLFELLYFILFAGFLCAVTKRYYQHASTAFLGALLSVGTYFTIAGPWHLTQAEGLVGFPLFICLWMSCGKGECTTKSSRDYFAFGLAAGAVAMFKLLLVLLPIGFFLVAFAFAVAKDRRQIMDVSRRLILFGVLPALLGFSVVLAPVIYYFASLHQLGLLYKTFFVYPPRIVSELQMSGFRVLLRSLKWFVISTAPLWPFAIFGSIARLRRGLDAVTAGLIGWLIVGTILILAQRMWWEYHFLLLIVPLGLLAACGLEALAKRRSMLIAGFLIVIGPLAGRWAIKLAAELRDGFPGTVQKQIAFRQRISPDYAMAKFDLEAAHLPEVHLCCIPLGKTGGITVIGNPLIHFLSGQAQALTLNTWSPEWFLPEQWDQLASELSQRQPEYIFIANEYQQMTRQRGPRLRAIMDQSYTPLCNTPDGNWYKRLQSHDNKG